MFNEMGSPGDARQAYKLIEEWVAREGAGGLLAKQAEAESLFRKIGITFAVYGEGGDPDRLIPFDMIPRVFTSKEWDVVEKGSIQRADALNAFLRDIYGPKEIIKAGIMPAEMIETNDAFEPVVEGYTPPGGIYSHVIGVDLVRVDEDQWYVLEDNCRTPSGVSYVMQNREVMTRMFGDLFRQNLIRPTDGYADMLAEAMQAVAPETCKGEPTLALLTPGHFNSAYFEHSYLADQMGIELVEGSDLFVENDRVYMRTTRGPEPVDVIYRRIDDSFLDPKTFNPDSVLGVPGIIDAMKAGGVTVVNAVGAGVADDKAIYTYVPDMIRFYLGEEPIIPNVPTWQCGKPDDLAYVLENLSELVVKEVHGSGGYGMLIGPKATKAEIAAYAERVKADPAGFIAQPTLALSTSPVLTAEGLAPRHVDLRPFVISGKATRLIPSGLTRVALVEGSLVVNSSQGGGVKDTWVLNEGGL